MKPVAGEHAPSGLRGRSCAGAVVRRPCLAVHVGPGEHAPCDPQRVDPGPSTKPAGRSLPTDDAVGRMHNNASIRTGLDKLTTRIEPNFGLLCACAEKGPRVCELPDCPICPTPAAEFVRSMMLAFQSVCPTVMPADNCRSVTAWRASWRAVAAAGPWPRAMMSAWLPTHSLPRDGDGGIQIRR